MHFQFLWTDEALGILAGLREILAQKAARARAAGAENHARLGLLAVAVTDRLLAEKPEALLLENPIAETLILWLDGVVAQLREGGIFKASEILRRMGWRTRKPGAPSHSPNAHRHTSIGTIQSPSRTGGGERISSPERRHVRTRVVESSPPERKHAGPFYTRT